jgi:uncharacterized protein YggE
MNMARIITVKGIGKVSAKPDYVVLSMSLEAQNMNYEKAMEQASTQLEQLRNSLVGTGFEKESVRTTNFNVRTDHDRVKDKNGNYQSIFNGYIVSHALKVEFDFNSKRLADALSTVATCLANPQLTIAFTVKDATAINEEMLRSATVNAKRKAEILCEASNVKMGQLLSIDYNWGELNIYSNTRYDMAEDCMPMMAMSKSIDIEPDDIDVSDTATFVWEIQ